MSSNDSNIKKRMKLFQLHYLPLLGLVAVSFVCWQQEAWRLLISKDVLPLMVFLNLSLVIYVGILIILWLNKNTRMLPFRFFVTHLNSNKRKYGEQINKDFVYKYRMSKKKTNEMIPKKGKLMQIAY